jgi:BCD family chlorophyll transporter-like MFS transporter
VSALVREGALGPALTSSSVAYGAVYHVEIALLFATLIAVGPLVRPAVTQKGGSPTSFGLAGLPS